MKAELFIAVFGCLFVAVLAVDGQAAAFPSGNTYIHIQTCSEDGMVDIYSVVRTSLEGKEYSCAKTLTGDVKLPDVKFYVYSDGIRLTPASV